MGRKTKRRAGRPARVGRALRRRTRRVARSPLFWMGLLTVAAASTVTCAHRPRIRPPGNAIEIRRTMLVTGYSHDPISTNWKRNWLGRPVIASGPDRGKPKKVGITASGTKVRPGTLAADTSIYPFGTIMYIPGYGYGRVEDRGGAIKGQHIDLYFPSRKAALKWGKKHLRVTVWVPRR